MLQHQQKIRKKIEIRYTKIGKELYLDNNMLKYVKKHNNSSLPQRLCNLEYLEYDQHNRYNCRYIFTSSLSKAKEVSYREPVIV